MPSLKLRNPFRRDDTRPSLRQRAAALKASAARVIRRQSRAAKTAAPDAPPGPPLQADPIFAAIQKAHALHAVQQAAYAVCGDLPDAAPEWGPEREAYRAWFDHIDNVLMRTVPTTAAGCVALARFAVDFCAEEEVPLSQNREAGDTDNIVPLRLIAQSPALAGATAYVDLAADPVFAAIDAHAAARKAFGDATSAADRSWVAQHGGDTSDAGMASAEAARDAASDAEDQAWEALLSTRPTTTAGVLSLTQHVARWAPEAEGLAKGNALEPVFASILTALSSVLADGAQREDVDWHDAPPGFMAYPAFEPIGFRRILDALPDEVTRLHCAASTDLARRMACVGADVPEEERQRIEAQFRQDLMLPALTAAIDPESDGARALATLDAAEAAGHDAELILLGRQFDAAHAAWMALVPASNAAQDRVAAFKARAIAEGMDETAALQAAWLQDGVNEAHNAEAAAFDALESLNEAIMALPAHTVEGLAVKARSAIPTMWPAGSFEADRALGDRENWELRGARDVIEACMTLARRQSVGGLPSDGRIERAGDVGPDGMVLYEDASGALVRRPIAAWVAFMAQRLYGIASKELNRQYNQGCGDDTDSNEALDSRLRRDLRIDALSDLAFRSRQVFEVAEAKRRSDDTDPSERVAADALQLFDFKGMTAFELMTLHNHARAIRHVAHGLIAMPCSRRGASSRIGFNAAGSLPNLLADLTDSIMEACIASAGEPGSDPEAEEERLCVLAEHVIFNGDPEPIRTLARNLNAYADRA